MNHISKSLFPLLAFFLCTCSYGINILDTNPVQQVLTNCDDSWDETWKKRVSVLRRAKKAFKQKMFNSEGIECADSNLANQQENALIWAAANGNIAAVETLKPGLDSEALHAASLYAILFNHKDLALSLTENGEFDAKHLVEAIQNGTSATLEFIWDHRGEDKEGRGNNIDADTGMHYAVIGEHDNIAAATFFLSKGANVNFCDKELGYSLPVLHYAASFNNPNIVELLIKNGVQVNAIDHKRRTPLHMAALHNTWPVAEKLINLNASIDAKALENDYSIHPDSPTRHASPLYLATKYGYKEMVTQLISAGADVNIELDAETVLHVAVRYGHTELIKFLLNAGANIDEQNFQGMTSLHLAAKHNNLPLVQLLIHQGADINLINKEGVTARQLAEKEGYHGIAKFIETLP